MGRKLRVLIIDDIPEQADALDTQHLELMQMVSFGGSYDNDEDLDYALSSWTQHLWLWAANAFPAEDADLVLIDCRFEEDQTSPPLGAGSQDPRGLLNGAVYVARMFGRDRFHPFGFAPYSQDASGFRGNPYAQTFMGFLLAMRESTVPEGGRGVLTNREEFDIAGVCNEVLARTINQYPATAWSAALRMYRQRLGESFSAGAYVVDSASWKACYDAVQRGDNAAADRLSLSWRRFGGLPDSVLLSSLFADHLTADRWSDESTVAAKEWLDSFPVLGDCHGDALEWADVANDPDIDPDERPDIPRGKGRHGETFTTFFHASASVCAWLKNRMGPTPNLPSGILVRELDLSAKQVDRYFKRLVGRSWGNIVAELDQGTESMVWPFPELWELRSVVADWARIKRIEFPFER